MFCARVILKSTDVPAMVPLLDGFARECGLHVPAEVLPSEGPATTRVWKPASEQAALQDMRATFDTAMDCGYVDFRGSSADGVEGIKAKAQQRWPVWLPPDLVREAVANWRTRPTLLPCAAMGVNADTEAELAQAIFEALCEADDKGWDHAATAAALMPPTQSHWLVGVALVAQTDNSRREKLERLKQFLESSI